MNTEIENKDLTSNDAKPVLGAVYTEKEVDRLLEVQRGNCYVAVLSGTKDENIAILAGSAPEPSGGRWRK